MPGVNSLVGGGSSAGAAGGPMYFSAIASTYTGQTTESFCNSPIQSAATFSKFAFTASANSANCVATYRIAGVNGNQTVTLASGTATYQQDATHSDSPTAGQAVDIVLTTPGGNAQARYWCAQLNNTTPLTWYGLGTVGTSGITLTTAIHFGNIIGATFANNTTFTDTNKGRLDTSGTLSNLQMNITTAPTGTVTVFSYNGANGNQTLSFSSGTGWHLDSTHTDSVTAGQDWGNSYSSSNATGVFAMITYQFAGATNAHDCCSGYDNSPLNNANSFFNFTGIMYYGSTTESQIYLPMPFAVTTTQMRARTQNGLNITSTVNSRVNGGNGNQTVSFSSSTGLVTDATHSDSIAANATYDASITAASGSMAFLGFSVNGGGAQPPSLSLTGIGP